MSPEQQRAPRVPRWLIYVVVGLASGLMSGLFGVGGGTVIVPLLVLLAAFDQRLASGTSLAAIVPTAVIGVVSYAIMGEVSWGAAGLLGGVPRAPRPITVQPVPLATPTVTAG
ncbi:MAG TPA: sulfite exporter TauE/SafE family protein, partial [Arachnia sp.]|nr:sulfite exporter TauE/SafE family protein [Arachnia sp.]